MDEQGNDYDFNYDYAGAAVMDGAPDNYSASQSYGPQEFFGPPAPTQEQLDAQATGAAISTAAGDYADRLAADLAKVGASVVGAALNSPTARAASTSPYYKATRALFDKNQTTNTGFGAAPVLIGGLLLIGGAYALAKLS